MASGFFLTSTISNLGGVKQSKLLFLLKKRIVIKPRNLLILKQALNHKTTTDWVYASLSKVNCEGSYPNINHSYRSFLMESISFVKQGLGRERSSTYPYSLSTKQGSVWYHFLHSFWYNMVRNRAHHSCLWGKRSSTEPLMRLYRYYSWGVLYLYLLRNPIIMHWAVKWHKEHEDLTISVPGLSGQLIDP